KGNYGAGDLIVWDLGDYTSRDTADVKKSQEVMRKGLAKGEIKFILYGEKLKGGFTLVKLKNAREDNAWLLIKERDEYVSDEPVANQTASVLTGKTLPRDTKIAPKPASPPPARKKSAARSKTARDPMPHRIRPMLARLTPQPFDRA